MDFYYFILFSVMALRVFDFAMLLWLLIRRTFGEKPTLKKIAPAMVISFLVLGWAWNEKTNISATHLQIICFAPAAVFLALIVFKRKVALRPGEIAFVLPAICCATIFGMLLSYMASAPDFQLLVREKQSAEARIRKMENQFTEGSMLQLK